MISKITALVFAMLSLAFYRLLQWLSRPYLHSILKSGGAQLQWHPLSVWLRAGAGRTFAMMLIGPRWNCAGTLAISDSFEVKKRIRIRADQAAASARYWTVVVYDMNSNTVAHAGDRSVSEAVIDLPAGIYFLALRYYRQNLPSRFPEVMIDDNCRIAAADAAGEEENYRQWLANLAARPSRLLYLCMHYHAWALLRLKGWFDEAWVNRQYLPVGNPATGFTYGTLQKGERIVASRGIGVDETVYLSIYNRASIPVFWTELTEANFSVSIEVECAGTWLVRRISHDPSEPVYMVVSDDCPAGSRREEI